MTANQAASVRARLKQYTDTLQLDFKLTLTRYGLERLLYRLSISEHASNFLLNGTLPFQRWYGLPYRPTRGADLLRIRLRADPKATVVAEQLHTVVTAIRDCAMRFAFTGT